MKLYDYIRKEVPTCTFQSPVEKAQAICTNFPVSHVFIVENQRIVGCFSESDVRMISNSEHLLEEYQSLSHPFFTDDQSDVFNVLHQFVVHDCNTIPCVDHQNNYKGYYELNDVLSVFCNRSFLSKSQLTIVVETSNEALSMSEISQIIERNNGKLLGMFVSNTHQERVQVTIKIAPIEINEIVQTFRRYEYEIISEHQDDFYLEELKNRSRYLQKFLSV